MSKSMKKKHVSNGGRPALKKKKKSNQFWYKRDIKILSVLLGHNRELKLNFPNRSAI